MSKPPDETRNGGSVSRTAAPCEAPIAKPKADVLGVGVKALRMARWIDMAIVMHRMGATDPAEFQRLGLWLQRMRRAVG
jgi:hypothetical protein